MGEEKTFESIGCASSRLDAWAKVAGRAVYVVDMKLRGMLYGKVLRSSIPHEWSDYEAWRLYEHFG
jgi:CO/xanthine dehydrogenase Mo-binding subunit